MENPWKIANTESRQALAFPSHGRGRRFNPLQRPPYFPDFFAILAMTAHDGTLRKPTTLRQGGPPAVSGGLRRVQTLRARNSHIKRIATRQLSSVLICMNPCGIPSITCSS